MAASNVHAGLEIFRAARQAAHDDASILFRDGALGDRRIFLSHQRPARFRPSMDALTCRVPRPVLSVSFWLIDRRNEQLVDLSRKQLCTLEKARLYSDDTSVGVFNAADKAKAPVLGLGTVSDHHAHDLHRGVLGFLRVGNCLRNQLLRLRHHRQRGGKAHIGDQGCHVG